MSLLQGSIYQGYLENTSIIINYTYTSTTFTSNSSWTVPSNAVMFMVEAVGGGGAAEYVTAGSNRGGRGGGGGGFASSTVTSVTTGTTYSFTIGQNGVGTFGGDTNATDTNFNSGQVIARAGRGGANAIAYGGGDLPGSPNVGDIKYTGGYGAIGASSPTIKAGSGGGAASSGGTGGSGVQGDGAGGEGIGGAGASPSGDGGNSYGYDPILVNSHYVGPGYPGQAYGGGGGGGATGPQVGNPGAAGGNGADGYLKISWTART